MGFFFSLGLTFLILGAFVGIPKLILHDFYPKLSREHPEFFFQWNIVTIGFCGLGSLFLVISLIVLIWS